MPTQKTPFIDRSAVSAGFDKAAAHYEQASFLEQLLCENLIDRLDFFDLSPKHILDLGTSTGRCARAIAQRFPQAIVDAVDISSNMIEQAKKHNTPRIHYAVADVYDLPFADNNFDLVISNLLFQLIDDLDITFAHVQKTLAPRGCFLFSTLGPDTFIELRQAWQQVDDAPHVFPFLDMHDVGDALIRSGFVEPLMDREVITITYDSLPKLLQELKRVGARNYVTSRARGLLSKSRFKKLLASYPRNTAENKYSVTIEVVYGLAWKGEHQFSQSIHDNEVHIPVEMLKRVK